HARVGHRQGLTSTPRSANAGRGVSFWGAPYGDDADDYGCSVPDRGEKNAAGPPRAPADHCSAVRHPDDRLAILLFERETERGKRRSASRMLSSWSTASGAA